MSDARASLARAQAALVGALTGRGEAPAGFDAARLRAAGAALRRKRLREAADAWPDLHAALGERFDRLFAAYADATSYPARGGPLADGRAFVRSLRAGGALPEAGRLEALRVDLFFARRRDGLVPRRGPVVRAALLSGPRRLVLAWRLPRLGARWFCLRLPGSRRGRGYNDDHG